MLITFSENPNFVYAVLRNHKRFEGKQTMNLICFGS